MFDSILEQLRNASPDVLKQVEFEIRSNVSESDMDSTLTQFPYLADVAKSGPQLDNTTSEAKTVGYFISDRSNLSRSELRSSPPGNTLGNALGGVGAASGNPAEVGVTNETGSSTKHKWKYVGWAAVVIGCATVTYMAFKYFKVAQRIMNLLKGVGFITNKQAYERGVDPDLTGLYTISKILSLNTDRTLQLVEALKTINLTQVKEWYETRQSVEDRAKAAQAAAYGKFASVNRRI